MQRKAYVPGVAALLAVLLAGCTGGSGSGGAADDSKAGDSSTSAPPAEPGKYRTLPEPCGEVDHGTLDALLPGMKGIPDTKQQEKAYAGTATLTFDTDRQVGCRWKMESPNATHHLLVDFERVVSYDNTVSDDIRAQQVFTSKEADADLPIASDPDTDTDPDADGKNSGSAENAGKSADGTHKAGKHDTDASSGTGTGTDGSSNDPGSTSGATSGAASGSGGSSGDNAPPEGLQSRLLDGLGDAAYLDDSYSTATSAARHRTVTVVFRTSNVIVTVEYDEQPARSMEIPDSKNMQDMAQELAHKLAGQFSG